MIKRTSRIFNSSFIYFGTLFVVFIILIFFLNPQFFDSSNNIKHWSTYHKDDIVFIYNSLLYAEGFDQEHLDHPSLFTFIIFPFFSDWV